jgi:hypothetical protein
MKLFEMAVRCLKHLEHAPHVRLDFRLFRNGAVGAEAGAKAVHAPLREFAAAFCDEFVKRLKEHGGLSRSGEQPANIPPQAILIGEVSAERRLCKSDQRPQALEPLSRFVDRFIAVRLGRESRADLGDLLGRYAAKATPQRLSRFEPPNPRYFSDQDRNGYRANRAA